MNIYLYNILNITAATLTLKYLMSYVYILGFC